MTTPVFTGFWAVPAMAVLSLLLCGSWAEPAEAACSRAPAVKVAAGSQDQPSLRGTNWRLVEIQDMNDTVVHIKEPAKFTFAFGEDRTLTMRLSCNRASASWSATPSAANRGSLQLSRIAATHMICPPPSPDQRVTRDLKYVRSYILRDDRLYISLMADGGIYVLERIEAKAERH